MTKKIPVLLAGLPGKMATKIVYALSLQNQRYEIIPSALTSAQVDAGPIKPMHIEINCDGINPGQKLGFWPIKPDDREEEIQSILRVSHDLIVVDFTQPSAKIENCKFYCEHNIPFVMGTTGGDNFELASMVTQSSISAVIAPNMSAPIVILMDMFAYAATNYPGALQDWEIRITESHQAGKKDVSGTALAIGTLMKKLGVNFTGEENIRSVRDRIEQLIMGIPELAINGHGYHEYSLISPTGNEFLGFKHNINGHDTYVDGTLKSIDFLAKKIKEESFGNCFSMIDVIRR